MSVFESQSLAIHCAGEELWLHPSRVIYWPRQKTLFVADVHVGKEHVFARQGIAIPAGISEAGLHTLFELVKQSGAEKLRVLGDFMHATPLRSENWLHELQRLLDLHDKINIQIVAGNHDKRQGRHWVDSRVQWHEGPLKHPPFILQHEPGIDARGYVLCGHLHPAWRIGRDRRSSIRTPVFWLRDNYAVLPAFGEFTGGVVIDADPKTDRLFMATPDCVIEVPVHRQR